MKQRRRPGAATVSFEREVRVSCSWKTLLLACLATLPSGCVTPKLMERYQDARSPAQNTQGPAPMAVEALRAVRAGDGSYHVVARYTDDTERRLIVEPLEAAPVTSGSWPEPARAGARWPRIVEDTTLPEGVPVRVAAASASSPPDPELQVLVGDVPHVLGGPVLEISANEVRLVSSTGAMRTLANLPRRSLRPPPPSEPPSRTLTRVGYLALLPFALVADVAIVAVVAGAYALPYVLPILLKGC